MKVGLLIGGLCQGGAERQLMRLAGGLVQGGHQVEVFCYDGGSPHDTALEAQGVVVRHHASRGRLAKIGVVRRWLRDFEPDIAHGFMKRASGVAVLARLVGPACRVLASDFSTATYGRHKPSLWAALCLFALADRVVTQTDLNRRSLEALAPWLRGRVAVVRNGLDVTQFRPALSSPCESPFRFCVVGSVYGVKNPERVVRAVAELYRRQGAGFHLDWFGRRGLGGDHAPSADYRRAVALADQLGVQELISFHGETRDIERVYQQAHALVHVSLQEGFPNAVVEGMACGLPIVVSRVSDLPLVVKEARNGFLCDETDSMSIAGAMEWMLLTSAEQRLQMGERSRRLAMEWFHQERFIDDYLNLYAEMLRDDNVHRLG
ncbi:glycosyltransferase family 4 protein [Litchfieldella rifensis]|uniref:Glycosyltransferase family 4 protein n=1 Tax=Litchfieldella rifensis TaxID=762643 RepID=A0ABV7LT99_9GAMM